MSADQQRQMQELQLQMARLQTEIEETKQREKTEKTFKEKASCEKNPTPDFINEPLENNVPIDPENFKEMHAFMFDEPEVYGKWRQRQQELNTDNFTVWRRKFNAHIKKNMTDHRKFFTESPYREQDLVAAWGWHNQPLKKLPSTASKTDFSQDVFPRDIANNNLYPGVSQLKFVESVYNMFKIQQHKIEELEKMIGYNNN